MDVKAAIRAGEFRIRKALAKELLDLANALMMQAQRQIARARAIERGTDNEDPESEHIG